MPQSPRSTNLKGRIISPGNRDSREAVLEPFECGDVAVACRGLADREHLRRLVVVQLLEVPKREDLPIDRVHRVRGLLHPELELRSLYGPRGRGQPAQKHRGQ